MPNNLTIRIGGEGGEGVISSGELLTLALGRSMYDVFTFRTYPAEIKGGAAMFQVRCGNHPVLSQGASLDALMAFNQEAIDLHAKDLKPEGMLFYDPKEGTPNGSPGVHIPVPLDEIADKVGGKRVKNVVALSAMAKVMSVPRDLLREIVRERWSSKGTAVVEKNLQAVDAGYDFMTKQKVERDFYVTPTMRKERKLIMSGNEAISAGAIFAGCRFYAGYPITPASDILEFMEHELPRFGGIALQTEDEIAAITSCIGASFAGKKAMTATSGPGLSLMIEAIGLASMVEMPLVIIDAQRGGPSTGMPTKTEQSDLMLAVFGGHGDAPRVVMAPANVKDCFYGIVKAFNIAEKYQTPVIFLSDQSLSHRTQTYTKPNLSTLEVVNRLRPNGDGREYKRFELTKSGVSPMAIPGESPTPYVSTGLEHNEAGDPNYTPVMHFRMTQKRHKKLEGIAREKGFTRRFGAEHANIGIISWGSTEGPIEEALLKASALGYEAAALQVKMLNPLPDEEIKTFLNEVKAVIVPELNYTGQFSQILRSRYLVRTEQLNKCAGVPFFPDEIVKKIEEVSKKI